MTKEEIKQKEDRLGELFLCYHRQLTKMNDEYQAFEKIKNDLTLLAEEIEQDYVNLDKEQDNGEKLC